jgi:beta-galactosidase
MNLGAQYYRPPFPDEKYWADDLARMADSGLDTVQLWVLWGWVEATCGQFRFDDYDRLIALADRNGLGVVLSTIAEIHPYWIHREVPGSEMIDHMGHTVISSNRSECHFGITPGGCFDHPGVWERMSRFLTEVATRYVGAANLRGWDAWNELRWNVHADGLVCFCAHTIAAFRKWLDEKYGGLDGLNAAWRRRYSDWQDVAPGKLPDRPYTEMIAFQQFVTWRANRHGARRYQLIRQIDPDRPITVHAGQPCALMAGDRSNHQHAINRGNDWAFADDCDGVGCSSFPKWAGMDDAEFAARIEYVASASQGKRLWLSELQGGRAALGFSVQEPVDPASQQRWIYNGIACGAEMILFWCWRDEVFGRESGGFGLAGADGFADARLEAMRRTGALLEDHRDLIDAYRPDPAEVGVLFSPTSYYLAWAQEGTAARVRNGLAGYCRALVRRCIGYTVVEEDHLEPLADLKILFAPRAIALPEATAEALYEFVIQGGTLVCESECGAFSPAGLYRYPQDRFTAKLAGSATVGRRAPAGHTLTAQLEGETLLLPVAQWLTPWPLAGREDVEVFARTADGAVLAEVRAGAGRLVLCGAYLGDAYLERRPVAFERLCELLVRRAGWQPVVEVLSPKPSPERFVYVKHGRSGGRPVVFAFLPAGRDQARLRLARDLFGAPAAVDLITDEQILLDETEAGWQCTLTPDEWPIAVLTDA